MWYKNNARVLPFKVARDVTQNRAGVDGLISPNSLVGVCNLTLVKPSPIILSSHWSHSIDPSALPCASLSLLFVLITIRKLSTLVRYFRSHCSFYRINPSMIIISHIWLSFIFSPMIIVSWSLIVEWKLSFGLFYCQDGLNFIIMY